MIDIKWLFYVLLFGSGFYFYYKQKMDMLVLICIFVVYVFLNENEKHENFSSNEAVQTIANMYNSGTLKASNIVLTGDLTVGGNISGNNISASKNVASNDITVANSIKVSDNLTITKNMLESPGRFHFKGDERFYFLNKEGLIVATNWGGTGNFVAEGNIYMPTIGKSLVIGKGAISSGNGNFNIYRVSDGTYIYGFNNATLATYSRFGGGGLTASDFNAYSQDGVLKPEPPPIG
ncbi:hypothetical protein BMW23_1055 [Bodo saltans virus]|jgi:hypothetical protein|uniref:Uncharacterized protein n=1 Tax=Bodo saltans virus TaxID=2024608 RepID=A0A2H4UWJ3_9VIRU|nr:hypothetical protein QJ851_gp1036 [Bodo saltans virus]ATZ81099.1 hypothetical protein BMW23_1055 [Bodo saltans virus]